ncbi:BTB/POZ domain-containing protein At5g48800-like isoform X2 [Zingiber officinale]|uniref:BTB/POZ domain-containing protein At5g48800-like isoform X2 n=1 Tax=Zingiber officinale TaxID=94328 RepID=UPI001C4BBAC2|nr:BTB/POZ domain-containing protein At5g48800-like isoform X2 [Zingiber officinale]
MNRFHHQQLLPGCSASSPHKQRRDDWIFLDVPSDVTIEVAGVRFQLHKFPLVAKSGRIRRILSESIDGDKIQLPGLPGGPETFRLAAKFCYGVHFELTAGNVAELRCASDYLEMTGDYAGDNLATRCEAYLEEVVCKNLEFCVEVLRHCEGLLPLADELGVVSRCADGVAATACAEQIAASFSRLEYSSGRLHVTKKSDPNSGEDWWIQDLSVLRIDLYRRVVEAVKGRGIRPESVGASLVDYAEKAFRKRPARAATGECEGKAVVETIASLLPAEKHAVSVNFLFGLLRSAIFLDCSTTCRLILETRIGSQLESSSLDDLLLLCAHNSGETIFDVDTVHRILLIFSHQEESDDDDDGSNFESDGGHALDKVAKLVDGYLAEIAPDANLKLAKFIAVADTLPAYSRSSHDGLYRAIDIYLKAHDQALSEMEKKRLCKLIDFHKLSPEACAHAAQNERLPVQATVQVLYIEQLRLRSTLCCSPPPEKLGSGAVLVAGGVAGISPRDSYACLRRENKDLKLELARMRIRLSDLEKGHACMKHDVNKKSHSRKLVVAVTKKIRKLNLFTAGSPSSKHEP